VSRDVSRDNYNTRGCVSGDVSRDNIGRGLSRSRQRAAPRPLGTIPKEDGGARAGASATGASSSAETGEGRFVSKFGLFCYQKCYFCGVLWCVLRVFCGVLRVFCECFVRVLQYFYKLHKTHTNHIEKHLKKQNKPQQYARVLREFSKSQKLRRLYCYFAIAQTIFHKTSVLVAGRSARREDARRHRTQRHES